MAAGKILYYKRKRPPNGGLLCVRKPSAALTSKIPKQLESWKRTCDIADTGDDRIGGAAVVEGFLFTY